MSFDLRLQHQRHKEEEEENRDKVVMMVEKLVIKKQRRRWRKKEETRNSITLTEGSQRRLKILNRNFKSNAGLICTS